MEQQDKPHKRRVRYSGTHPKKFSEKYKELNPEKYGDEVAKIIQKGSTPAGMHISICVQEILDFLKIQPGQTGLDATLGYGGHTAKMLEQLQGNGHIFGLDIDPIEIDKTSQRLNNMGYGPEVFTPIHTNFAQLGEVSQQHGKFDFMLADLGVSSMQIDNPERGFTYKREGPLDLRLNPEKGISAAERLRTISKSELEGMLIDNSDEPYAAEISKLVMKSNKKREFIDTTGKLKSIVEAVVEADGSVPPSKKKEAVKKCCQRTFQALRIDVNSEFEVLYAFLDALPDALKSGGRVAVLTFHSGEDRLVKQAFKTMKNQGIFSEICEEVIRPSAEECRLNPRATSTKMRWAIRA